jgi:hypothetical protein
MGGACSRGEEERVYVIEGKETTRKTKTNLGEIGWVHVDWIGLAEVTSRWRALVNWVFENSGSKHCCETIEWLHN